MAAKCRGSGPRKVTTPGFRASSDGSRSAEREPTLWPPAAVLHDEAMAEPTEPEPVRLDSSHPLRSTHLRGLEALSVGPPARSDRGIAASRCGVGGPACREPQVAEGVIVVTAKEKAGGLGRAEAGEAQNDKRVR